MKRVEGKINGRKVLAKDIFLISIDLEEDFERPYPGNFVMLAINDFENILPRPFSIYYADKRNIKLIIKALGAVTNKLLYCNLPYKVSILGPLGNSFPTLAGNNLIVSGGIGIVPLYGLIDKIKVDCFFAGFKTKEEVFLTEDLSRSCKLVVSTDDGSFGESGFITDVLENYLIKNRDKEHNIFTCGPMAFLKRLWEMSKRFGIDSIYGSFETYMACGFGVCLGCTIETPKGHVKVCKDGPIFKLNDIFGE